MHVHGMEKAILGGFHLITCLTESFVLFSVRFSSWIITCCLKWKAVNIFCVYKQMS